MDPTDQPRQRHTATLETVAIDLTLLARDADDELLLDASGEVTFDAGS